jgi:hypothetical protein
MTGPALRAMIGTGTACPVVVVQKHPATGTLAAFMAHNRHYPAQAVNQPLISILRSFWGNVKNHHFLCPKKAFLFYLLYYLSVIDAGGQRFLPISI